MGIAAFIRRVTSRLISPLRRIALAVLPPRARFFIREFRRQGLGVSPAGRTVVFYRSKNHFPKYWPRRSIPNRHLEPGEPVTLVVTVRNEERNAGGWLQSLLRQTRHPDEVVIVDGGSTDATPLVLDEFSKQAPFSTRVIMAGNVNIARGRNMGIEGATHDVIVNTDMGCELDPDWLELLTAPFLVDRDVDVSAGWYEPLSNSQREWASSIAFLKGLREINPATWLPSARSVAFRREAWERAGRYPEWLTLTGEDTYFVMQLRSRCANWAFVPEAKVNWHAPATLREAVAKAHLWSWGDGEAGLFPNIYRGSFYRALRDGALVVLLGSLVGAAFAFSPWIFVAPGLLTLVASTFALMNFRYSMRRVRMYQPGPRATAGLLWTLWSPLLRAAGTIGFIRGVLNRRSAVGDLLAKCDGVVVILSGVPIHDSGGGQRATQLALNFLERNHLVFFVNRFPSYETVDLQISMGHPLLVTSSLDAFDPDSAFRLYAPPEGIPITVIIEFPLREFTELAARLKARGAKVIFDCIDDWTTSLGGDWYSEEHERRVISISDGLAATAEPLRRRLSAISGRSVDLVPNAVNTSIFDRSIKHRPPRDLHSGDFVITYIGALWGHWFDWELLRKVADSYPSAAVAVIGDYSGQFQYPPPNLQFLGLKPQRDLPAYLAHTDVAIIPWIINDLTHTISPLKLFEYLTMATPVVAPRIEALEGLPYVLLSETHEEFIENIKIALHLEIDPSTIDDFVVRNSWAQRVDALLGLAGADAHLGKAAEPVR